MQLLVNGRALTADDWRRELEKTGRQHPDWPVARVEARARDSLIEWALIREHAGQFGGPVAPEAVNAAYAQLLADRGAAAADLPAAAEQRIKAELEQSLRVTRFLEELTRGVPPPSAEAVARYYEEHQADLAAPELIHVLQIIRRPAGAAAAVRALVELSALRRRLAAGEDFLTLAAQTSERPGDQWDLGFLAARDLPPEFAAAVGGLPPGALSPIFQTVFGYHLATVRERRPPRRRTLDECRAEICEQLHTDMKDDSIGRWVDAQKSVARIEGQE